ncbi:aminotransferase class I/II-fold pyridoxal phosphate-dependent enzyme [soil metagenome]
MTIPDAEPLDARELDARLLDAWRRARDDGRAPFTIPGHKRRAAAIDPTLGDLLDVDVPMFGGLGTIKGAVATLSQAEAAGADLWDADGCRYSTGGTTHANQALILALGAPGDTVLVSRTAHRSTLSALVLAGLRPVWLPPVLDPEWGVPTGLDLDAFDRAVEAHPGAVGVLLVEPGYLGGVSDLAEVCRRAHGAGLPLVVDQAWGAHFGFHPAYPPHALQAGADAMAISAHKSLPAYSQASVALARTERLDRDRLERAFDMSATTSPAGSILASIDASRALLADERVGQCFDRLLTSAASIREAVGRLPGVHVLDPTVDGPGRADPAKVVILLTRSTVSGNDIATDLIAAGVPVELADRHTMVPIVTLADDAESTGRFVDAFGAAYRRLGGALDRDAGRAGPHPEIPPAPLTPRAAFFARHDVVMMADAVGRVCAETIAPYPPGIPLLVPGETVTEQSVDALRWAADSGRRIAYAADPSLRTVQVVAHDAVTAAAAADITPSGPLL